VTDLLSRIYVFATATAGWTGSSVGGVNFDDSAGVGGDGAQIGIGNPYGPGVFICLGEYDAIPNPISRIRHYSGGPADTDAVIYGVAVDPAVGPDNGDHYWGHTGNLVTTKSAATTQATQWNGVGGTSMNLWMFSEAAGVPGINVVVEDDGNYTHLSFGLTDGLGMTTPEVGYVTSQFHHWYEGVSGLLTTLRCNSTEDSVHRSGQVFNVYYNLWVEPLTLPAGWADGHISAVSTSRRALQLVYPSYNNTVWNSTSASNGYLDGLVMPGINNQSTTLGARQYALPVFVTDDSAHSLHCCVGVLNGVRMMADGRHIPAGGLASYGTEDWAIFPWKRYGIESQGQNGVDPQPEPNTFGVAFAYKKNP